MTGPSWFDHDYDADGGYDGYDGDYDGYDGDYDTDGDRDGYDLEAGTEDGDAEPGGRAWGRRLDLSGTMTRRRFLGGLAVGGAAAYTGAWAFNRGDAVTSAPPVTTADPTVPIVVSELPTASSTVDTTTPAVPGLLVPAPVDQRILVLIELQGGNDGLSMVVPAGNGKYYDLRPSLAVPQKQVITIDDQIGLHPALSQLATRQLAIVEGVGSTTPGALSHFDLQARWENGDPTGKKSVHSGFLGRLADGLNASGSPVALSVSGYTARFQGVKAPALSIDSYDELYVMTQDDWIYPSFRKAVAGFTGDANATAMAASWKQLVKIGGKLPSKMAKVDEKSAWIKDGGDLARALATAAELLKADLGIRIVHATLTGFDTHDGHAWRYKDLMSHVDAAIDGFLTTIADQGMADRVLVATSSEFGRRVKENGNGFDHGAASSMLLFGPVKPGRYGEPPPLDKLDQWGNLKTTVPFDTYLGTLAQTWLGVDAASVLPTAPAELLPLI